MQPLQLQDRHYQLIPEITSLDTNIPTPLNYSEEMTQQSGHYCEVIACTWQLSLEAKIRVSNVPTRSIIQ